MAYHIFNIGKPHNSEWWGQNLKRGVITAGFEGDLGDRGTEVLLNMQEGDWVIAFANGSGFVGAGLVGAIETYRLHEELPSGSLSNHLHERRIDWKYAILDIREAVTTAEAGRHAPRQTKEKEADTEAAEGLVDLIRQRGLDVTVGLGKRGSDEFWLAYDAVVALESALSRPVSSAEVKGYILAAKPSYKPSNVVADLSLLSVNDSSRGHHQRVRPSEFLRSDQGHPHDLLYKRHEPNGRTSYQQYRIPQHGVWELFPDYKGKPRQIVSGLAQGAAEVALDQARNDLWSDRSAPIDPNHDSRAWEMRAVALRQGQPDFRAALLTAYGGKCAITGCEVIHVLEAAHIIRHLGLHTMRVDNGILLRTDIHTLFDLGKLWIDPDTYQVQVAESLSDSEYGGLQDKRIGLPTSPNDHPLREHLVEHRRYHGHG